MDIWQLRRELFIYYFVCCIWGMIGGTYMLSPMGKMAAAGFHTFTYFQLGMVYISAIVVSLILTAISTWKE